MSHSQPQSSTRILHNEKAFSQTEADWLYAFENSLDLWKSVDALFPDEQKRD